MKKHLLVVLFSISILKGFAQCYSVTQITYAPDSFNVGAAFALQHEDLFSDTISLPFQFCFYGSTYTKIVIGENGVISFNASDRNNYCVWPVGAAIPATSLYKNCIFFPYQDLITDQNPRFYTNTYGTSPNRRFAVSIYRAQMYGDTTKHFTGEVMLYETTNIIEIHIQRKDDVPSWNGGNAIEGMQNSLGTDATVVPGRNYPVQWTAYNDAWRFTSNCCTNGISSATIQPDITVYPNPASNDLHIQYANNTKKFSVQLLDNTGRIILTDNLSAENERTLSLENISAGIYFIRLIGENGEILEVKKQQVE